MATNIDNITYNQEKDINNSYLVIKNVTLEKDSYEYKILEEEKIDNVLEYRVGREDGKTVLKYDITNKTSLDDYLRLNKLKKKDIRFLMKKIYNLLATIENYLISENSILLDPRSIFLIKNDDELEIKFCIIPSLVSDFSYELSRFLVRILRHIDTTDKSALELAYALFIKSSKKNYSISDLMSVVYDDEKVNTFDVEEETKLAEEVEKPYVDNDLYEEKEEKSMKALSGDDFTSFIDDDIMIDEDAKKALGIKIFDEIEETDRRDLHNTKNIEKNIGKKEEKKENEKNYSLNAKIRLSYLIYPFLGILAPALVYVWMGIEYIQKNWFYAFLYEIILIILMSLDTFIDNLSNNRT